MDPGSRIQGSIIRNSKDLEIFKDAEHYFNLPICLCSLRGLSKNDVKLQMEKLTVATKMQDTHHNQDEVDVMVNHNKTFSQDFQEPILIPSQT